MGTVEIINGDHAVSGAGGANLPFVIINRLGLHVDLSGVGELWDPTVQKIVWGFRDEHQRVCGRIELKNSTVRLFYEAHLMVPYVDAYNAALARHQQSEEAAAAERSLIQAADAAIETAREDALRALQRKPVGSDDTDSSKRAGSSVETITATDVATAPPRLLS